MTTDARRIAAARDHLDALTALLAPTSEERLSSLLSAINGLDEAEAAIVGTGGGTEVLNIALPCGWLLVATEATRYADGWTTEPSLPPTEQGPWYVTVQTTEEWSNGDAPDVIYIAESRRALLDYVAENLAGVHVAPVKAVPIQQAEQLPEAMSRRDLDSIADRIADAACAEAAKILRVEYGIDVTGDFSPDETQHLDNIGRAVFLAMLANRIG